MISKNSDEMTREKCSSCVNSKAKFYQVPCNKCLELKELGVINFRYYKYKKGDNNMTKGEVDFAIRQAQNNFDNWNDTTGCFEKGTGYYYEILSIIEDAARIGSKIACEGINASLDEIIDKEDHTL